MKELIVFISGGGSNLQALIDACEQGVIPAKITKVISNRQDAYGLVRAQKHHIETELITNMEALCELEADGIVLAGFLRILPKAFVEKFENKIINIHPSLIPSFCGKGFYGIKVHQAVLDYGVKFTGCTTHFVSEGADEGPIIMQKCVAVSDDDTAETLSKKVLVKEHECIVETVKAYCEERIHINQRKVTIL